MYVVYGFNAIDVELFRWETVLTPCAVAVGIAAFDFRLMRAVCLIDSDFINFRSKAGPPLLACPLE
jgi:hypothetical protein